MPPYPFCLPTKGDSVVYQLRRRAVSVLVLAIVLVPGRSVAQPLARRIEAIMARPEFRRSYFGMAFVDIATGKPVYRYNADKFFVPGSTTKVPTAASAIQLLGADYRFHTRVYRTGPIVNGVLEGDLVLVASGDPNLSGRLRPDGTLAFTNEDHSYGNMPEDLVDGDPVAPFRSLVSQVKATGVRRIAGRVMVDISLFPEGDREGGTNVVISPMVLNDNLIDVVVVPGDREGAPATLRPTLASSYVRFVNQITTGPKDAELAAGVLSDSSASDGSRIVVLKGAIPVGGKGMMPYRVPEPSRFAEYTLADLLQEAGIAARPRLAEQRVDHDQLSAHYVSDHQVAEYVSAPMTQVVKVLLKVSQNLHASMMPYLLGGLLAKEGTTAAGFKKVREWETKAGLDLSGQSQGDGAGAEAHFAPDFMVSLLRYMATQAEFQSFFNALPVLGRDGTLAAIQVKSPAAGQVHAKTGTFGETDRVGPGTLVNGKGLAGYIDTKDGRRLAFAIYINNTHVVKGADVQGIVGQAIGEIAAEAWANR